MTLEIPVSYEDVEIVVPGLHHGGYDFIIHFGVGKNGFITLEQRAHSGGYYKKDIYGREGPLASRCMYVTKWDVHHLVHQLTQLGLKVHPEQPPESSPRTAGETGVLGERELIVRM
jgi:hypothetical protein